MNELELKAEIDALKHDLGKLIVTNSELATENHMLWQTLRRIAEAPDDVTGGPRLVAIAKETISLATAKAERGRPPRR